MADCYPPDFQGPLPPGGYYCQLQTPTVFGQINAILQQGANTAAQIRRTIDQYQGRTLVPVRPLSTTSSASKVIGFLAIAALVGLIIWLVMREL